MQVFSLDRLDRFAVHARRAEPGPWQGRPALLLEDGPLLLNQPVAGELSLEVEIWCPGPAYPGLLFHARDEKRFELVYIQPHTSGKWDALQYDPVFPGSNSWQLHHGPAFQGAAQIPTGTWLTLHAEIRQGQVALWVWPSGQPLPADAPPALAVPRLTHGFGEGRVGLWTYRPAYFSDLRIGPPARAFTAPPAPEPAPGIITDWLLEGVGPVQAEPTGCLLLNRFLSQAEVSEAVLTSEIIAPDSGELRLRFGFSDELELMVDGEPVFTGVNRFTGFADRDARGYVELGSHGVQLRLAPGPHKLTARLKAVEPFGWGLIAALG